MTTLHVIHHCVTPVCTWQVITYVPHFDHCNWLIISNTFVHVVMYGYYLLASQGPKYAKYLWIKKYITAIQLIQFVTMLTHAVHVLMIPDCDYPSSLAIWEGVPVVYFLYSFSKFYVTNYLRKPKNI